MVTSEILTRYYYLAILYPSLGEALHLVIKGGNEHGLDNSDHSRDLHRPRDQRLSSARVLSNVCRPRSRPAQSWDRLFAAWGADTDNRATNFGAWDRWSLRGLRISARGLHINITSDPDRWLAGTAGRLDLDGKSPRTHALLRSLAEMQLTWSSKPRWVKRSCVH